MHVLLIFLFQCISFKLSVISPSLTSIKETEKKKKLKQLTLLSFLMPFETWPELSSKKLKVI